MDDELSARKAEAAGSAIAQGLIGEAQPVAGFIDIDGLRATIAALHAALPSHFVHAFAAKAGSILPVLRLVREAGMGCEVASPGGRGFRPPISTTFTTLAGRGSPFAKVTATRSPFFSSSHELRACSTTVSSVRRKVLSSALRPLPFGGFGVRTTIVFASICLIQPMNSRPRLS